MPQDRHEHSIVVLTSVNSVRNFNERSTIGRMEDNVLKLLFVQLALLFISFSFISGVGVDKVRIIKQLTIINHANASPEVVAQRKERIFFETEDIKRLFSNASISVDQKKNILGSITKIEEAISGNSFNVEAIKSNCDALHEYVQEPSVRRYVQ